MNFVNFATNVEHIYYIPLQLLNAFSKIFYYITSTICQKIAQTYCELHKHTDNLLQLHKLTEKRASQKTFTQDYAIDKQGGD